MKPTNEALQVFYGTIPLLLVIIAAWLRSSMLLKDILARLRGLETSMTQVKERLTVLETRFPFLVSFNDVLRELPN